MIAGVEGAGKGETIHLLNEWIDLRWQTTKPRGATWSIAPRRAFAPWTLVEANNKYYARIKVLKTLCEALEKAF